MDLFAAPRPGLHAGDHEAPGPGQPPPPARAPRADHPAGLDDWGAPAPSTGPRRWLLMAAVVPWLVVVAIMVGSDRGAPATTPPPATAPTGRPADASATTPSAPRSPTPTAKPSTTPRATVPVVLDGSSGPSSRGAAEGVAVVTARAWLSSRPAGPTVGGLQPAPGADRRYVEHVVVESVDHPAPGAAVVTVRAVVLPVEGDRYGAAHQIRVAVPVDLGPDTATLAGAPWPLPVEDLAVAPPTTTPVEDPDLRLAAVDAVVAAGYRDVELDALERSSGWAHVARVTARAPGEDAPRDHVLWLRSDVGRLVVAGLAAPATTPPPTADAPTTEPTP